MSRGLGDVYKRQAKGRERAEEQAHAGHRVVAIERAPTEAATAHATKHGIIVVEGDAGETRVLTRARIGRAASVMIATGDDARNVGIARVIVEQIGAVNECNIQASVSSPLVRRAFSADHIPGRIDVFSSEELAAYGLCESARFFEIADLLGQDRVHVVIIGFDSIATHLTAQILRTNMIAGFALPAVTILCPRPAEAANMLRLVYPGVADLDNVRLLAYDPHLGRLDDTALVDETERAGPLTAVVTLGEGSEAVAHSLIVDETARRTGRWRAPIFFAAEVPQHFSALARPLTSVKRYADVLQPFDTSAALCRSRYTDERDRIARSIHARFLAVWREKRAGVRESLPEWDDLPLTYRQANRRAADHIPAKLTSAGCIVPHGNIILSPHVAQIADSPLLEVLSELEHDAWMNDRRLDGWRSGPFRDDRLRVHDLLVPYSQLLDETKELDRDQIRMLLTTTLPRAVHEPDPKAVRFDLWIGLIGTTNVARADTARLTDEVAEAVSRIIEARPSHYITLLSPLAPGADLIATKKALAVLKAARRPHRLLVPNVVRWREVVDSFEARWRAGAVADLDVAAGREWAAMRKNILAEIDRLIALPECERVLELAQLPLQTTEKQRQWGYRLQNAYIVERAHVVIAAVKGAGAPEPGGTREAVLWRRSHSAIPDEFRRYRKRPNPLGPGLSDLITIDLNAG